MKTKFFISLGSILMILVLTSSCYDQELSKKAVRKSAVNSLHDQLSKITEDAKELVSPEDEEMLVVTATWNRTTQIFEVVSQEVQEMDLIPLAPQGGDGKTYNVDCCCDSNGVLVWSKTCDGKWSCGTMINDCLEGGHCAEICTATIKVIPPSSTYNGFLNIELVDS